MSATPEGSSLADLLDSRRLFQFVVAAEAPTLAAAAADLFITQQALSSAIRQLERDLGVELFSRAQRSLQLTDAGHELYTGAKPLLAGIRVLANATRNISNPQRAFVIGHSCGNLRRGGLPHHRADRRRRSHSVNHRPTGLPQHDA